jgi:hypothetical protein
VRGAPPTDGEAASTTATASDGSMEAPRWPDQTTKRARLEAARSPVIASLLGMTGRRFSS